MPPTAPVMLTSGDVGGVVGADASSAASSAGTSSQTGLLWVLGICWACAAVIAPPVTPVPSWAPNATSTRFQRLTWAAPCWVCAASACTLAATAGSTA